MHLINKVKSCKELEEDTDQKRKIVNDSHLALNDADALLSALKGNISVVHLGYLILERKWDPTKHFYEGNKDLANLKSNILLDYTK